MTVVHVGDIHRTVILVIADTFNADPSTIDRATTADDLDGWDSLAHSVLMVRLSRKLGIAIGEEIASGAENVGQLIDMLEAVKPKGRNGA